MLLQGIDRSVDPCKDFYRYSCGRWPQAHPVQDSHIYNSWFLERQDAQQRRVTGNATTQRARDSTYALLKKKLCRSAVKTNCRRTSSIHNASFLRTYFNTGVYSCAVKKLTQNNKLEILRGIFVNIPSEQML